LTEKSLGPRTKSANDRRDGRPGSNLELEDWVLPMMRWRVRDKRLIYSAMESMKYIFLLHLTSTPACNRMWSPVPGRPAPVPLYKITCPSEAISNFAHQLVTGTYRLRANSGTHLSAKVVFAAHHSLVSFTIPTLLVSIAFTPFLLVVVRSSL
jgi:hypothetical protein